MGDFNVVPGATKDTFLLLCEMRMLLTNSIYYVTTIV